MENSQINNEQQTTKKRGEMIAVCSTKGGVGRTLLTVNLALALAKKNIQISLLDADFQFGDVCLAMDLQPTFSMKDIAESLDSVDKYSISSYLNHYGNGCKVLAAPERPEYADLVTSEVVDKVCQLLVEDNDYLIVDTTSGLQSHTLSIIEKADQILLVTNLEMATLKNTKLMLETFDMLGYRDKVRIVVNQSTKESVIQATDVADILGEEEPPIYIPHHDTIPTQSLNTGIPFVVNQGKTDIAKAVFKMAEQISSRREIKMFKPKSPSFIKSFFQRSNKVKEGTL